MVHHDDSESISRSHEYSDLTRTALEMYKSHFVGTGGLSCIDQLRQLNAEGEIKNGELEDFIERIVMAILDENEEFQENAHCFKTLRRGSDEEKKISLRQRTLYKQTRHAVLLAAGLPIDGADERLESARHKAQQLLTSKLENMENPSADAVLSALGIVVTDKKGQERFNYPTELFPVETNQKWDFYLDTVRDHLNLTDRLKDKDGLVSQEDIVEADLRRHLAHGAVTKDVDAILGLSELTDCNWNSKDTRDLVGKMRDKVFPSSDSAELHVAGRVVATALIGKKTLEALLRPASDLE